MNWTSIISALLYAASQSLNGLVHRVDACQRIVIFDIRNLDVKISACRSDALYRPQDHSNGDGAIAAVESLNDECLLRLRHEIVSCDVPHIALIPTGIKLAPQITNSIRTTATSLVNFLPCLHQNQRRMPRSSTKFAR